MLAADAAAEMGRSLTETFSFQSARDLAAFEPVGAMQRLASGVDSIGAMLAADAAAEMGRSLTETFSFQSSRDLAAFEFSLPSARGVATLDWFGDIAVVSETIEARRVVSSPQPFDVAFQPLLDVPIEVAIRWTLGLSSFCFLALLAMSEPGREWAREWGWVVAVAWAVVQAAFLKRDR